MVVKENELQQNCNGFTMKTSKENITKWTYDINEWFLSLGYQVSERYLNDGHQLVYTCDGQKFTFVYFTSGRITIKANNIEKLKCVFLDKHDTILGVRLREIEAKAHNLTETFISQPEDSLICSTPNNHNNTNKHFSSNGKYGVSNNFQTIGATETIFDNMEKEIMTLKDTLDKVSEEIVMLKNENTKLREKVCTCSSTHHTQTPEADVVNKVNELFKSQNKRFAEIIDRRITNSNRNINTIQLENKHIRNQLLAINENKTTVTDDINKLKSKIAVVATASESNRQRLIEIERTISSEFYPAHIPPPSENTPNRNPPDPKRITGK